jgi:hypothetical protein
LLSKNVIVLNGTEIECRPRVKTSRARKVTVADNISIPGKSEALVDVYIERMEGDDKNSQADFLVEPTDGFKDRYHFGDQLLWT